MPSNSLYVRSSLETDGLLDFIRSLGGDVEAIADESGLDLPPYPTKIHFISWAALCRFFEVAAERLNEPYLGLKWSRQAPEDYHNSGPTVFLGSIASDMRHFLEMAIKYQKIHTNGVAYSFEEDANLKCVIGVINIHPFSPPGRQMCEQIMAGIAVMGSRHVPDFKLQSVSFQHSAPGDLSLYKDIFRCPLEFDAARNTMVVDENVLKIKRTGALTRIISPLLRTYLNRQVGKNPKSPIPFTLMVSEILPSIFGSKNSDIATVATALDIHPKKLQRLLDQEGTSFSQITDHVKRNLADRLLTHSDMPIGKVAAMLDYSSDRSFGLATRRWFGLPPSEYRKFKRTRPFP